MRRCLQKIGSLLIASMVVPIAESFPQASGGALALRQPALVAVGTPSVQGVGAPRGSLTREIVVHGWRKDRKLWLDPELFLEFDADDVSEAAIKRSLTNATVAAQLGAGARIWTCSVNSMETAPIDRLRAQRPSGRFAEVLRGGVSSDGPFTAFSGGIIVRMRPELGRVRAMSWLHDRGATVMQELAIGGLAFVVATDAGLRALVMANELRAHAEVVGAIPVQWLDVKAQ